ncbi:MAG TPA: alpha/beta fold hydrolase, partial [Thermoanaerobaculia bacterium]|nr:alpha/beta fold hydrolase [Thermoanaerobaculia bacterium]
VSTTVESFDGTPIRYDLYPSGSKAAVLVVPGFWRTRRHPSLLQLAAFLAAEGTTPAICDLRGHGESGGVFGFNRDEHHDIAAVAHDLLRRAPGRLALLAFSYGAAVAITAAARDELPLAGLIGISSVADFAMISPRINPFTIHRHIALSQALKRPRFQLRPARAQKYRAVDEIANVHAPLCLIHVKHDWLVDHKHSLALYERGNEPKELHILEIPGNYHADRIFRVAPDSIYPIVAAFLRRHVTG